jgi:hypothetical protein
MKEICTFRSQKGKNRLQKPINGIWTQNQYVRVIYPSIGNFSCGKKKMYFWRQKEAKEANIKRNLGPKINMVV